MTDHFESVFDLLIGKPVSESEVFSRAWAELEQEKILVSLSAGEVISSNQQKVISIGCIIEGSLSRTINNGGNQHLLAAILRAGDLVGIECLLDSNHCQTSYLSRETTKVCLFPVDHVHRVMSASPHLLRYFLEVQSCHMQELLCHMQVLSNRSLKARVAAGILYFNGKLGVRPWTNKELAAWAGVTQEGVGRSITSFLEKGWVRKTGRRTHIQKRNELEALACEFKVDKAPHLVPFLISSQSS